MNTDSLRFRVSFVTLGLLALVLAVVITAVTLAYRSSLQRDLRHHLTAAGKTVERAGSGTAAKELVPGLALEGIATKIGDAKPQLPAGKKAPGQNAPPVKPGTSIATHGSLLALNEVLPDGTRVTFTASDNPISHAVNRLLLVEIAVALAALALASLLVLRGTKTALRPLAEVIATATKIAAGERSLRLRPTRTDTELGRLAAAFDQMVDALEGALTQAEETEAAMRRFLADAAHELRTPVAALQASVETLLREQPERPHRDEQEAALARNTARLGRLINDLLNLARLEGTTDQPAEPIDVHRLLQTAVADARRQKTGTTITLKTDDASVRGDEQALLRVLTNLLDNALAAVPPAGNIEVNARVRDATVEVQITDNGPGIPEADREHIFQRFSRLNQAQNGTGLGLAIARRIARQHNGDLTCDPSSQGATFTLTLPVADSSRAAE
ncbi:MAG: HAMP domain-containing sensor histidine kinase [Gaiellaceae bacterium]